MILDKQIIRALFDSYFALRADKTWGQKEFDPIALAKKDPNAYAKVLAFKELNEKLEDLDDLAEYDNNIDDWLNFVYMLAEKGRVETDNKNTSRSRPLPKVIADTLHLRLGALFAGTDTRAENTMHAVSSFIIN